MNGLEVARRMRQLELALEILILSEHYLPPIARKVLKEGARGFALKSEATRDLIPALDALRNNRLFVIPRVGSG